MGHHHHHAGSFYIDGKEVRTVTVAKDLGVLISSDLKSARQVEKVCLKARARMGVLLRNFSRLPNSRRMYLFNCMVRPILEYCSCVWSPPTKFCKQRLESVQRFYTKTLKGFRDLPYSERLRKINATTLEERRVYLDLLQSWKIIHGKSVLKLDDLFNASARPSRMGHKLQLSIPQYRKEWEKTLFHCRVIQPWNELPHWVAESTDVKSFKTNFHSFDSKKVDICL